MTRGVRRAGLVLAALVLWRHGPYSAALPGVPDDALLPQRLADTGLYGRSGAAVDPRNRPFAPQYPLWSDGAAKRRWIYLPEGQTIDATRLHHWEFPVGTRFWKEFSFAGRRVETRFLWKASTAGWVAGSYVWNEDNTGAVLAPDDGIPGFVEIAGGRRHSIPSRGDCAACHGAARAPLGFQALQLSDDRDPNAIHGEELTRDMVTLRTLIDEQRLSADAAARLRTPPRIAASHPQTRALLGYLSANCGTCHNRGGEIAALVPSLTYEDVVDDGDAVARHLVRGRTRWQAPGKFEGSTVLVDPDAPDSSAILLRMRSRRPSSQMPPLGTVMPDHEAIDGIARWIRETAQPR